MNYWKQFAEMLGLELEQEFSLIKSNGEKLDEYIYKITEHGLCCKEAKTVALYGVPSVTLDYILNGDYKAVPKPWKPKKGERYWFHSEALNQTLSRTWYGQNYDLLLWKLGNCFKTDEEARTKGKEIMEQIKKEFEEEQKC